MADEAPVLAWMGDASGARTYFNRAWLEFTGRTMEQELGEGWAEGVHPEDLEGCMTIHRGALATREPFEIEYRLRHRDGQLRWIAERGAPMGAGAGFTGFVGACVDIHDGRIERERQGVLADVAAALDAGVGVESRLRALVALLANRLGDLCVVEMPDPDGRLRVVASAAGDPGLEEILRALQRRDPPPAEDPVTMEGVARTGRSVLVSEVGPDALDAYAAAAGLDPEAAAALRARPPRSIIIVPLPARSRILGVLLLLAYGERRLDEADLALVGRVGRRAALAIDNARLFRPPSARRTT